MRTYSLYDHDQLPTGFQYPAAFLAMAADCVAAPAPWFFIDPASDAGRLVYSLREQDGRNLVPFAVRDTGDGDTACFDGNDTSGNPAVLMLIFDESGRSYAFNDFNHWLSSAEREAPDWQIGA